MPIYEYRCPQCSVFEVICAMSEATDSSPCPSCQQSAPRKMGTPHLSRSSSAEFRLFDATKRSAHQPQVVRELPGTKGKNAQHYTTNPLHKKLPRP
ncbi:FmdB family zinc ribbon protein [Arthrobacter sp. D1-17]